MSTEAMYIVLRAEIDKPAKKSVLIGLAEHAWPDGSNAFPGVERIAAYTSLGESTV
ncbi:MAG: helix-turn-helix domain-containing protein, partial [Anaerolineae bacterium]|nr:helix-turn-helix domain-containing protein [Anaerolineae bacterium]